MSETLRSCKEQRDTLLRMIEDMKIENGELRSALAAGMSPKVAEVVRLAQRWVEIHGDPLATSALTIEDQLTFAVLNLPHEFGPILLAQSGSTS